MQKQIKRKSSKNTSLIIKTLETILLKSVYYFLIALAFDSVIFLSLYALSGYDTAVYVFGLLIFLETAALFLAGGIADFTESYGSINLRNFFGKKKVAYSKEKHKKNEVIGASLILAGIWFIALAFLMFIMHIP
ncbi:MAG: hypothetical protein QXV32_05885 [Conexivisphaerales archaeon]